MVKKFLAVFVIVLSSYAVASDNIILPSIISDNMTLQQQSNVPIWGWSQPNEQIFVNGSWSKLKVKAIADANGKWMTKIKTPKAGGPYTLTIENKESSKLISNVMIGEVWLCSGQSNMELSFLSLNFQKDTVENFLQVIKEANYPNIRLFKVPRRVSVEPDTNCLGSWEECNPETIEDFSAVAYFFGKELHQKLNIPIGLIHSSWGGSAVEIWADANCISQFPSLKEKYETRLQIIKDSSVVYNQKLSAWKDSTSINNLNRKSISEKWMMPEYNDSSWSKTNIPIKWSALIDKNFTGVVWLRKTIDIPENWVGKDLIIELGFIKDWDITWLNGNIIGQTENNSEHFKTLRKYSVSANLFNAGKNYLTIRVTSFNKDGGLTSRAEKILAYPVNSNKDNALILSGEWKYKIDFDENEMALLFPKSHLDKNIPSVLYNGMIHPIVPFGIRGAIWYQGESNRGNAEEYSKTFPAMVKNWRNIWKQGNFPFYYVQIAPFKYNSGTSEYLRESQLFALKTIPNSGMAVTMDIGDLHTIHPPKKEEVGKRLAYCALAKTYGKNIPYSGPVYKSMKKIGKKIVLFFDYAKKGLVAKDGPLKYFTIAGKDSVFYDAVAEIRGNTIVVYSDSVKNPIAVRFGWSNTAITNLFNKEGLPASSFRTDNWPEKK